MFFRRSALVLVILALVACNNEKNRNLIDRRTDQAARMEQEALVPAPKKSYNPLVVSDKIWSGSSSIRLRRGVPLPSKYEGPRGVALISSETLSLNEIAVAIGTQTGIPLRVGEGASEASGGGAPAGASGDGGGSNGMTMAYEGPLSGLLDLVAGNFGVNWRYDGATIRFSRYETRVFVIEALPGSQSAKDGIKDETTSSSSTSTTAAAGGTFSAGTGSSLTQSSEMNVELKFWDELNQTISSILGGVGSVVVSPTSGTATVTTTPEVMHAVAKFIEEENKRQTQQIAINVEIYSVNLAEDTDFNVTFDTALKKLSNFGGNISSVTGPSSDVEGMGTLSIAILNPKTVGQVTSVFSALSSIGDTTRVTQFPLTTLNNRTVSRRVGRDRSYVAAISNTESGSDYSSSTVTPGAIPEGFSLQLTPRVLEDGRIMLQYSFSLIDIIDLVSFDTGAGNIQLPETSNRVFVQQALLKSGSTLIVGGYDDEQTAQASSGVGNAYNYFLGGGSYNAKRRGMMFIAITPQVLRVPKSEQE